MSNKRIRKKKAKRVIASYSVSGRGLAYMYECARSGVVGMSAIDDFVQGNNDPGVKMARQELARQRHGGPRPKPESRFYSARITDIRFGWTEDTMRPISDWLGDILVEK